MALPKRPKQHVTETASYRILKNTIPDEWILRDITERDYGVDCYIEIVGDDSHLTGDMAFIQLKGTDCVKWKGSEGGNYTNLTGINKSTAEYWMELQVPVFVFMADISTNEIFSIPARESIRHNYYKFLKNSGFSLKVDRQKRFSLKSFLYDYRKERNYEQFKLHLITFISNLDVYIEFIMNNRGRHEQFEVDSERHLYFIQMYNMLEFLANYLNVHWSILPLEKIYNNDLKRWHDKFSLLHEDSLTYSLNGFSVILPSVISNALNIINDIESSFWINNENTIYNLINSPDIQNLIKVASEKLRE